MQLKARVQERRDKAWAGKRELPNNGNYQMNDSVLNQKKKNFNVQVLEYYIKKRIDLKKCKNINKLEKQYNA